MTRIAERTVLFADLRGSTSLFETLGNAEATSVVTHCITTLAQTVVEHGGTVVKTLGDGLMVVFDGSAEAGMAAAAMHDVLDALVARGEQRGASAGLRALRLQVALARGEIVEMGGDCFGDAVNVAARLLDHAGDNETLVTAEVYDGLPASMRLRFRSLDRLTLRGRAEPVSVLVSGGRRPGDAVATQFGGVEPAVEPDGIRLTWLDLRRDFTSQQMPVVLGRSPQASFCVDDSRVSRSHARIDWHGGAFQLVDLSYNGTYVQFADGEIVSLRRGHCTLHGAGLIGLGGSPADLSSARVRFEVLHVGAATLPRVPAA
jgi:class 3 adenylate cyclase